LFHSVDPFSQCCNTQPSKQCTQTVLCSRLRNISYLKLPVQVALFSVFQTDSRCDTGQIIPYTDTDTVNVRYFRLSQRYCWVWSCGADEEVSGVSEDAGPSPSRLFVDLFSSETSVTNDATMQRRLEPQLFSLQHRNTQSLTPPGCSYSQMSARSNTPFPRICFCQFPNNILSTS